MGRKSTKRGPSLLPQNVNKEVWYYEDDNGLDFVVYQPGVVTPIRFNVPAKMLRASLERIGDSSAKK